MTAPSTWAPQDFSSGSGAGAWRSLRMTLSPFPLPTTTGLPDSSSRRHLRLCILNARDQWSLMASQNPILSLGAGTNSPKSSI